MLEIIMYWILIVWFLIEVDDFFVFFCWFDMIFKMESFNSLEVVVWLGN